MTCYNLPYTFPYLNVLTVRKSIYRELEARLLEAEKHGKELQSWTVPRFVS